MATTGVDVKRNRAETWQSPVSIPSNPERGHGWPPLNKVASLPGFTGPVAKKSFAVEFGKAGRPSHTQENACQRVEQASDGCLAGPGNCHQGLAGNPLKRVTSREKRETETPSKGKPPVKIGNREPPQKGNQPGNGKKPP